ncbi:hypothetical protein [Leptospira interrogans]|uniref:hypothetical protein n=1 Tax=Leptospira interrogans TaxID=173 RepID=UPI0005B64EB2|nr:hypothetical protein [Leptospira interrogans]
MITFFDKLRLCLFPLLISVFALSFILSIFFIIENFILRASACLLFIYFLIAAYKLFTSLYSKIRSILILIKKNRSEFKIESFEQYMQAPCGRQVVKVSLSKLGYLEKYNLLKNKFPLNFFIKRNSKIRTVYYKNEQEINLP